jgi:amidase
MPSSPGKLREAGGIIIGKATLSEFANFIGSGLPAGYSGYGGYGFNPYNPGPLPGGDGRALLSPGGSSSGSGIAAAANLAALTIGTETSGSILSPSNANGIVGIKPTVGLVSRDGIIPITADQDTAGPMTRSVTDAAILLGVIAGYDPSDPATEICRTPGKCPSDYTPYLDKDALQGARLAVPPFPDNRAVLMEAAIARMEAAGATVVRIPAVSFPGGFGPGVLNYGQKRDVNAYLASLPASFPIRTLSDLIAFNAAPPPPLTTADTIKYTQIQFINSNALDISPGQPRHDQVHHRPRHRLRAVARSDRRHAQRPGRRRGHRGRLRCGRLFGHGWLRNLGTRGLPDRAGSAGFRRIRRRTDSRAASRSPDAPSANRN